MVEVDKENKNECNRLKIANLMFFFVLNFDVPPFNENNEKLCPKKIVVAFLTKFYLPHSPCHNCPLNTSFMDPNKWKAKGIRCGL